MKLNHGQIISILRICGIMCSVFVFVQYISEHNIMTLLLQSSTHFSFTEQALPWLSTGDSTFAHFIIFVHFLECIFDLNV